MSDIKIDTESYAYYEQRFADICRRLSSYNAELNSLRTQAMIAQVPGPLWKSNPLNFYSTRLSSCKQYLRDTMNAFDYVDRKLAQPDRDPVDYNPEYTIEDLIFDPGKCVQKSCTDVSNWWLDTWQGLGDAWNDFIKDPGKYVHTIIKGALGVAQIAIGIGLIVTGVGTAAGIFMIINGANDLINAGADAIAISRGMETGGYNFIKDTIFGGALGGTVSFITGNKELGNVIGRSGYMVYEGASWILPGTAAGKGISLASKGTGVIAKSCSSITKVTTAYDNLHKVSNVISAGKHLTKGAKIAIKANNIYSKASKAWSYVDFGWNTLEKGVSDSTIKQSLKIANKSKIVQNGIFGVVGATL